MKLSPGAFNTFLGGNVRQDFGWRQSFSCPCYSRNSGAANPACPQCHGKAVLWNAEITTNCFAGMTNQTPKKGFADFGMWAPGDATLTIPGNSALYAIGQYDRVRALNSTETFSEHMTRGDNDKLTGTIKSIGRVFWLTPDLTTIVEGGIPTVGSDGTLTWASGAPPSGTGYSISGVRYDEFYVYDQLASDRNSGVTGLPLKLMVRKFDLFGR